MTSHYALYRFFSIDKLLYIGQTCNPARRFGRHAIEKEWWREVVRIEISEFSDRVAVLAAEAEAIRTERPLYNIRMNGDGDGDNTKQVNLEIDGLIGLWFHSWEIAREEDKKNNRTIIEGKVPVLQGKVTDSISDDIYIVDLFGWWDGTFIKKRLVKLEEMLSWTFYVSSLEMQCALKCRDYRHDNKPCRRDCERIIRLFDGASVIVCSRCAKAYGGTHYEILWRDDHPIIGNKIERKDEDAE